MQSHQEPHQVLELVRRSHACIRAGMHSRWHARMTLQARHTAHMRAFMHVCMHECMHACPRASHSPRRPADDAAPDAVAVRVGRGGKHGPGAGGHWDRVLRGGEGAG